MRFFIIIFFLFSMFANTIFADMSFNSKMNVLENYLKSQKINIKKICESYDICHTENIKNISKETDELILAIKELKNNKNRDYKEEVVIKIISNKIQEIKKDTKKYLKKEVEISEKNIRTQQKHYNKISKKIEYSLQRIIEKVYDKKIRNMNGGVLRNKLTSNLIQLKRNTNKLKKFRNTKIRKVKIMKKDFLNILLNVKKNIVDLKRNLK